MTVSHGPGPQASPTTPDPVLPLGLSEAEAAERRTPLDLAAIKAADSRRFFWRALRKNLLSPLNLDLFTIGIIMYLLDSIGGAIGAFIVLAINVTFNMLQAVRTKKRLDSMIDSVRTMATVVRGGRVRSIDPVEIVRGDVVIIAPGDLIPVDGVVVGQGELVVEEPLQGEAPGGRPAAQVVRRPGERLVGGSYSLSGHALYEAKDAGAERLAELLKERAQILYEEKTPLQRLMLRVFQGLGVILVIFAVLLLVDTLLSGLDVLANKVIADEFRTWLSILFAIAPTSMLFIFVVQYAGGSQRIADAGALVPRVQAVEKLATVSALCFSRESLLSGLGLKIELVPLPPGHEPLSYPLVRRTLGDLAHSATSVTNIMNMLKENLPGERRRLLEEKPLVHDRDWYGASFAEADMRGTFVVAERDLLEPSLLTSEADEENGGLRHVSAGEEGSGDRDPGRRSWAAKLFSAKGETDGVEETPRPSGKRLVLAYWPEAVALFNQHRQPVLPERLVEVAGLDLTVALRPELSRVIRGLLEEGVAIKVLATPAVETGHDESPIHSLSTSPLLKPGSYDESLLEDFLTAGMEALTPASQTATVQSLRDDGFYVAMVGTGTKDLPAMLQADVALTLRGGSPALLEHADVVLMDDSLQSLPRVLRSGQRVVHGLIDTLKLNLTPVFYQFLLIILLAFVGFYYYPFHPNEAAMITIFAVILPNIFLTFWANPGRSSSREMSIELLRFVGPAALATAALAAGVYLWMFARTGDRAYTQVSVTWALLVAAWLRVFFVEPPSRRWVGASRLNGDKRIYGLVAGTVILFAIAFAVPFAREEFRISPLDSLADYGVIALCLTGWYLALLVTWRLIWPLKRPGQNEAQK